MIATYIQELLATNNRVIVPNYGAFLVRATSKSKDANTLEEKLKDIYFSPFLKFNDELLEKYIIKKEGVTKEQAAQKIKDFIDDVKKELDQEKPYVIEGFGQFTADKQGKVQFTTVTKEPAAETKTPEKKATETKPARSAGGKATAAKKTREEVKKEEKPVKEIKEPQKEIKPTNQAGGLKEFKAEEESIPQKEEPKAAAAAKPTYSSKKQKKPVNKGLVWSIAIGLPVAAIFIWALLNYSTVKKVFTKEKAKTEKVAKSKKPVKVKKTTKKTEEQKKKTAQTEAKSKSIKQEAKTEAKTEKVKTPAAPQKKYYIIAGSFKNEKYAVSYLNKLKADGYNAEKLAERNGMHAVSYNSFADKRKAIAEYKFLAQEKGLQAWILYY